MPEVGLAMTTQTDRLSSWQVSKVRADTIEATNSQIPEVRFILNASKRGVSLEAFEKSELVEEVKLIRAVRELILEASEAGGHYMRLAISPSKETTITHVLL